MNPVPLFKNAEWSVYEREIIHAGYQYRIHFPLNERRQGTDLWDWVLHLGEKTWFKPREFAEAFIFAMNYHGIQPDAGFAMSFFKLGMDALENQLYDQTERDLGFNPEHGMLQSDVMKVVDEVSRRLGRK